MNLKLIFSLLFFEHGYLNYYVRYTDLKFLCILTVLLERSMSKNG